VTGSERICMDAAPHPFCRTGGKADQPHKPAGAPGPSLLGTGESRQRITWPQREDAPPRSFQFRSSSGLPPLAAGRSRSSESAQPDPSYSRARCVSTPQAFGFTWVKIVPATSAGVWCPTIACTRFSMLQNGLGRHRRRFGQNQRFVMIYWFSSEPHGNEGAT
jgi:hypothetical protein